MAKKVVSYRIRFLSLCVSGPRCPEHVCPGTVRGALTLQVGHAGADTQATDFQTANKGQQ